MIGGVIILLTWMYYTMFVVLIGGELASELHHGTGAIASGQGRDLLRPNRQRTADREQRRRCSARR